MIEPILTLDETKLFLRILHDDEDTVIAGLIQTATETAMAHADGLLPEDEIPESVRTSALLHVCRLYDDRHTEAPPQAAATLANRYRKWDV
ncbi:MAG: phage gp6-like head-tail connector protein [Alphaproteobacteria bacterium]|nr:MAG: phage gp6-like head-tail connector protein [Alphaproteobacteria bacterium]PZO36603.1 MAG: phage gp6-like head-tail connector protein [Alphaproteobacteria bacterium]